MDVLAQYPSLVILLTGLFSLLIGSFLNVVVYRLPIMIERDWIQEFIDYYQVTFTKPLPGNIPLSERFNLALPASTCPHCGHIIKAVENIPVISYWLQKGQCNQCHGPISVRYPMIEGITAITGMWTAWHFGWSWQLPVMLLVSYFLIAMIAIDLDKMLLPDSLTLPLLWLGLLVSTQNLFIDTTSALIGAALGYIFLWSVYWVFKILTGKEGIGHGDFKLLAAIGAFVGWQHLLIVILLSSVTGVLVALMLPLRQLAKQADHTVPNNAFPFGPFLGLAGWLTMLYGDDILSYYYNWLII